MKERIFTDENGEQLIVRYRKSAVFFERKADVKKANAIAVRNAKNQFGAIHEQYVCETELKRVYNFSGSEFKQLYEHCYSIANEAWEKFTAKEADSMGAEYDDYYDKEFDNNGSLSINTNTMHIKGPYAQPKTNGEIVRLIKFNKRKFESFLYDFRKVLEKM